jgi:predicted glycoside hydrolase/deacetylase ChbG (UPF0249 family)
MKMLTLFMLVAIVYKAWPQTLPPRLIVRGDDMGYSHAGNMAILRSYKEGIETSIEVLVPSPWFPEAVRVLAENPAVDVGIHLTLTSEWDNIKWRPLSTCPSLRDADGYFYPMVRPNKNYPKSSLVENDWQLADIEQEFRAQIELALRKIPRISHVSAHMGCTTLTSDVEALAKKLAREYKIDIDPVKDYQVLLVRYEGPRETLDEKMQSFLKMLEKLEPGKTYLFVDHPGLDNQELKAIYLKGNDKVSTDRQGVTDLWTSPTVKAFIKKRQIQLISYKDLIN